ncbi:hypothetical protein KUF54_01445 [Comamonas sp. Y33R10-2]|uniref:hypothetical protein n=1 Tax=Comamonas sp. Y33R10-2 TaxID=2853257 RepID=UPI001C5CB9F9|nr:hypothetical protein [Comamonas sp. Y33R10-2]QXZ09965.1 hypothetical protein KUF54_01445 [Comamonas sp. Y33R10-2]
MQQGENTIPSNVGVCRNCEEIGDVRTQDSGNAYIELALWLCFLVPGIIYSAWRRRNKVQLCGACGSKNLVAARTAAGRKIIGEHMPAFTIGRNAVAQPTPGEKPSKRLAALVLVLGVGFTLLGTRFWGGGLFGVVGLLAIFCGIAMFFVKPKPAAPVDEAELISLGKLDE